MQIFTVSIIGLGAVGAVVASKLTNFLGNENVRCIVDEGRKERYLRDGIFINGKRQDFNVVLPEEAAPSDLIIIATKNLQLADALKNIKNAVGENSTIMSLLNGIQSERDIAAVYGNERVLYSFIVGISAVREQNKIALTNDGTIVFGEESNEVSERVKALQTLFTKSNIASRVPAGILLELWKKFLLNVVFNTLSALCRAPYGAFNNPSLATLARKTGAEVIAVANAEGVPLTQEMFESALATIRSLDAHGKTSMLQDMEAGRKSENAWFCGTINKLGKAHNIPTPICAALETLVEGTEMAREI